MVKNISKSFFSTIFILLFLLFSFNFVFAENTTIIYTGNNTTQIYQSFDNTDNGVVFNFLIFSFGIVGFVFFLLYFFRVNSFIYKFSALIFSFYVFFSDLIIIFNVNNSPLNVVDIWIKIFSVLSFLLASVLIILFFVFPVRFAFFFVVKSFKSLKKHLK